MTSEFGSASTVWHLLYNGDIANTFTVTAVGAIPNQSEDGIFVTAQRITDIHGVPEPGSLALLAAAGLAAFTVRRRQPAGAPHAA